MQGVTALQLDTKLPGMPVHWLQAALQPARTARLRLLSLMEAALAANPLLLEAQPQYGTVSPQGCSTRPGC